MFILLSAGTVHSLFMEKKLNVELAKGDTHGGIWPGMRFHTFDSILISQMGQFLTIHQCRHLETYMQPKMLTVEGTQKGQTKNCEIQH